MLKLTQTQGLVIHEMMRKPNSFTVIIHFLNNLPSTTLPSEFAKVSKRRNHYMDKRIGNWVDFELTMITQYLLQILHLSCQLHMLLHIDCMLLTNQSFQSKASTTVINCKTLHLCYLAQPKPQFG